MSETWTEYALRFADGSTGDQVRHRKDLVPWITLFPGAIVVGRNVTASDWLPVDTDGAK